ncbi:hypothetical protein M426DRAFT_16723 [Hypoxylon sp. CI-4A]|nr:hypothetical protein M426DRAFT_16723 [Hypoxylon sp. CI-4A]
MDTGASSNRRLRLRYTDSTNAHNRRMSTHTPFIDILLGPSRIVYTITRESLSRLSLDLSEEILSLPIEGGFRVWYHMSDVILTHLRNFQETGDYNVPLVAGPSGLPLGRRADIVAAVARPDDIGLYGDESPADIGNDIEEDVEEDTEEEAINEDRDDRDRRDGRGDRGDRIGREDRDDRDGRGAGDDSQGNGAEVGDNEAEDDTEVEEVDKAEEDTEESEEGNTDRALGPPPPRVDLTVDSEILFPDDYVPFYAHAITNTVADFDTRMQDVRSIIAVASIAGLSFLTDSECEAEEYYTDFIARWGTDLGHNPDPPVVNFDCLITHSKLYDAAIRYNMWGLRVVAMRRLAFALLKARLTREFAGEFARLVLWVMVNTHQGHPLREFIYRVGSVCGIVPADHPKFAWVFCQCRDFQMEVVRRRMYHPKSNSLQAVDTAGDSSAGNTGDGAGEVHAAAAANLEGGGGEEAHAAAETEGEAAEPDDEEAHGETTFS